MNTLEKDLMHDLNIMDNNREPDEYGAEIVSILMLQRRGKTDAEIEKRLGLTMRPEHKMKLSFNDMEIIWKHIPKIGELNKNVEIGVLKKANQEYTFNINDIQYTDIIKDSSILDIINKRRIWIKQIKA